MEDDRTVSRRGHRSRPGRDTLDRSATRVTYWIAPGRRIILLTVFHNTRMRDDRQVDRARRALARCVDESHTADEED